MNVTNTTQELSYYQKNIEKCRMQARALYEKNKEQRNLLQREYNILNKERNKEQSKLYYQSNKERLTKNTKVYRNNNKEKCKDTYSAYYIKNKIKNRERHKEYNKTYRVNNRNKIREYHKLRYKTDIQYKLSCNLRSKLYKAIKCANTYKSKNTEDLLGCSFSYLKEYLEKQFKPGMCWENHTSKGWHIDHIIPSAFFDLTDLALQKKCFHYTNLRPIWATENLIKNSIYAGIRHYYKKL